MRCADCRHWDADDTYNRIKGSVVRKCGRIPMFWDSTEWDEDCDRILKAEYADQKAFVQDASDYSALLLTRADFFCAHFAEKDRK